MSRVRLDVSQSRGHGFENHPAPLLMSGKFVYLTLPNVSRVKDRSRRKRKEALQVVTRSSCNNSSATIRQVALPYLNRSRQVAALSKYRHLKLVRWHHAPSPPPSVRSVLIGKC